MPIGKKYRRQDPTLPEFIVVRIIKAQAKIRGKKRTFWVTTSLLNRQKYPANEILSWCKKRWKVEGLIEELKMWMGADILRSKTVDGILKEIYTKVTSFNLIHWLILKTAKKYNKDPQRLSVSATLRLTMTQSLKMSTAPAWQLPKLYDELLYHIAHSTVPFRPDRIEPRMTKRKPKEYPTLKIPRSQWRYLNALAA